MLCQSGVQVEAAEVHNRVKAVHMYGPDFMIMTQAVYSFHVPVPHDVILQQRNMRSNAILIFIYLLWLEQLVREYTGGTSVGQS